MSDDPRRYSDEEFATVLHRALQLQERRTPGRRTGDGLTLEEMKAAARDVGIDPSLIERAVSLLPRESTTGDRLLGGPTRFRLTGSVPRKADPEDLAAVVDTIRAELGIAGRVASELEGITWETKGEPSEIHVLLQPKDDRTELRVTVNRDAAFILTWLVSVTGGIVASGITGTIVDATTAAEGALIMGTGAAGGLTLARLLWGRSTRIVREKADRLMELIEQGLSR